MKFHREGKTIISVVIIGLAILNVLLWRFIGFYHIASAIVGLASLILIAFILYFFRVPSRKVSTGKGLIISPADGKVVAIETVEETEFLKTPCRQISIFMSPLNVHINWHPVSGKVIYEKYHPGKYLVAWHPKSSTENERTTTVVEQRDGTRILFRQIAGAVARRIVHYPRVSDVVEQSTEMGFIKFGSRVDVLIPVDATVSVKLNQMVKGAQTILAKI